MEVATIKMYSIFKKLPIQISDDHVCQFLLTWVKSVIAPNHLICWIKTSSLEKCFQWEIYGYVPYLEEWVSRNWRKCSNSSLLLSRSLNLKCLYSAGTLSQYSVRLETLESDKMPLPISQVVSWWNSTFQEKKLKRNKLFTILSRETERKINHSA